MKLPFAGVMIAGQVSTLTPWEKRIISRNVDWPTPTAKDGPSGPGTSEKREGGLNLRTAVALSVPTPTSRDWKSGNSNLMQKNSRPLSEFASNGEGGPLNAVWVEWLMGFELQYTNIEKKGGRNGNQDQER